MAAFSTEDADYIKTHGYSDEEAFAFWDYGVELSRRFRALKVWLTLQYYGTRRIAEAISEDISLAAYLGEVVSNADDFELLAPVELSICCFRYAPKRGMGDPDLNRLNERIMELVSAAGITLREAIRQKDTPYDALGLGDTSLSDDALLDAIGRHPVLLNRPFVETPIGTRLCRPSELVLDILENPDIGPFTKEDGEVIIDAEGKRLA